MRHSRSALQSLSIRYDTSVDADSPNHGEIALAVSENGTRTKTMVDNRCQPLSLYRCNVKGST